MILCSLLWGLLLSPTADPRPSTSAEVAPTSPSPTVVPSPPAPPVKPVAELERVQFLAGDWVHEKEVYHGGDVTRAVLGSARSKASWINKGHHLQISYKSRRESGEYEARGIVSWDAAAKEYQLDWFDSLGQSLRFSGNFNPAGVLVLSSTYDAAGTRIAQSLSIKKQRNGKVLILDERAIGNAAPALFMESLAMPAAAAARAAGASAEPATGTSKPTTWE
jgi:hypothetical protein